MAAPPTIGSGEHPFDPDWPDVYLILAAKLRINDSQIGHRRDERPGTERANFTAYESLVASHSAEGKPIIVPDDPEASLLWRKVRPNHVEDPAADAPDSPEMPVEPAEWLTGGGQATIRRRLRSRRAGICAARGTFGRCPLLAPAADRSRISVGQGVPRLSSPAVRAVVAVDARLRAAQPGV